jgi:hypothetical protein
MSVNRPECIARRATPDVQLGRGFCYTFTYAPLPLGAGRPGRGFGGVAWQSPPNNWGSYPTKRVAQGAKGVRFVASSDTPGIVVSFGVGSPGQSEYPFRETFSPTVAQEFTLTKEAQAFTLEFGVFQKYDRILSGFNWTISSQTNDYARLGVPPGGAVTLYVDDVVWSDQ